MTDFFEIDFLDVETEKSGDAIPLRYQLGGITAIHVVDGGYQETGPKVVEHIRTYYNNPGLIDHVVATHPDGDHAGGLRTVLEAFTIANLWMLRPWIYAGELLEFFPTYGSAENLRRRLRECYPHLVALEEIAVRRGIPIREPFQGAAIGAFTVLSPTRPRYLELIIESDRTPESRDSSQMTSAAILAELLKKAAAKVAYVAKALWGVEAFPPDETSSENEMSVVQYANLCGQEILLTADAGRRGLGDAADFAPTVGLYLPGIDRFQVPHHGSRRNVSTALLDRWLGPRLAEKPQAGQETFTAIISSAKKDEDHPRKAVVRAMIHRGAKVVTTEGRSICTQSSHAPNRGWGPVAPMPYPEDQEEV